MKKLGHFYIQGFTMVELMLVISILLILMSIGGVSTLSMLKTTYLSTTVDVLVSDLKRQQLKAMNGYTEGRASHDHYGIHFETSRYVLFHGLVYSAADSTNIPVNLDNNIRISSNSFPSSQLIFTGVTGEVAGFSMGSNTITIENRTNSEHKVVTLNRYGVITSIN
jgi:prepilin-type N-terminal cleavage/methylation domain-containing protein